MIPTEYKKKLSLGLQTITTRSKNQLIPKRKMTLSRVNKKQSVTE